MDGVAFDRLTRALAAAGTRRVLRLLAVLPLAGLLAAPAEVVAGDHRRHAHRHHAQSLRRHVKTQRLKHQCLDAHNGACTPTGGSGDLDGTTSRSSQAAITNAIGPVPEPGTVTLRRRTLCDDSYDRCAATAQTAYDQGTYRCSLYPTPNCERFYRQRLNADLAACAAQFWCASPNDCQVDRVSGYDPRCCLGQQACAGQCVPWCPPRKLIVVNDSSCGCVCDPFLAACEEVFGGLQRIRDPDTCLCRCLTDAETPCSLVGGVRDPATCLCHCADPRLSPCAGRCVDLPSDPQNCGTCGNVCAADRSCCGGLCVALTTDQHCGRCGTNLQPPWKCCLPPGASRGFAAIIGSDDDCQDCFDRCLAPSLGCCSPDQTHSTRYCDPGPTREHCGWCGQAITCSGTTECCRTPGGAKPPQFHCANLQTSVSDCGGCGNGCAPGRRCLNGTCQCPAALHPCGRTSSSGPEFCCDTAAGMKCCGGSTGRCVDVRNDRLNCGNCGVPCSSGKDCVSGTCVCPSGSVTCGSGCCPPTGGPAANRDCCSGVCVDKRTDPSNCGVCGTICRADMICEMGHCICRSGEIDCAGRCCKSSACCPSGCCPRPGDPAAKTTCCSGQCVDTQTNPQHCNQCGRQCPSTTYTYQGNQVTTPPACSGGRCVCPPDHTLCNGTWCMPNRHPLNNVLVKCCPPSPVFPDGHSCPTFLRCCDNFTTGTSYNYCCQP
jgi:hypothetical protein